jgi:translation initiation factor 1 (eIF-1/SUI1)
LDKAYDPKKILKAFKKVSEYFRGRRTIRSSHRPLANSRRCSRTTLHAIRDKHCTTLRAGPEQEFACNGNVVSSEEAELGADAPEPAVPAGKTKPNFGQVIQLQGDQRNAVRDFLVSTGIVSEREAKEKIQM